MNLMGGLEALANFGTGYNTGQQQSIDRGYQNQMNAVAVDTAQTQNEQMHSALDKQSQLNDMAMKLFSPATSDPLNPGKPAGPGGAPQGPGGPGASADQSMPNGPSAAGQATDISSPVDKLNALATKAAGIGDLASANQLWTNASNMATNQFKQQQEQAATQVAQVKATIASHGFVAQTMGAATNAAEWQQAKMAVLSSPIVPQNEKENLARMPYSPQGADMIRRTGMTSAQQGTEQLKQLEFQEKQRQDAYKDMLDTSRKDSQNAYDQARIEHLKNQNKVGAAGKGPSRDEVAAASSFVKDQMGPNVDTSSPNFQQAVQSIAARAKQIANTNRAITYPQAVQQATDEAQKNHEFTQAITPQATILSMKIPGTGGEVDKTRKTFSPQGTTKDSAMDLPASRADLIPGKWYKSADGRVEQYNPQGQ
jgi:hypothetical protein